MKFDELRDLLKEKFGIDHLADIAREVGVSPQAVSNWKARDNVPYKYIVKLRNQFDGDDIEDNKLRTDAIGIENQNFHNNVNKISITDFFLLIAKELKIIILSKLYPLIFLIKSKFLKRTFFLKLFSSSLSKKIILSI